MDWRSRSFCAGKKSSTNNVKNNVSAASPSTQSSRPPSGEKSRGSRVLKDFIKIFSPESSPKRKAAPEAQDSSGKNGSKGGVEDKFSISGLEADEGIKADKPIKQNAFSAAPSQVSQIRVDIVCLLQGMLVKIRIINAWYFALYYLQRDKQFDIIQIHYLY